jgi:glutathione S-transferase
MKLVGSKPSPYTRKVRVVLAEKRLPCEFVEENAWSPETKVPQWNPLNKVPALVLDDGEALYDSAVIVSYLDGLASPSLMPAGGLERARVLRMEALGDGICDAGILLRLERNRADEAKRDPAWISRQKDKVAAGIAALSSEVARRPAGSSMNLGDIACACALLWVEFRLPEFAWREDAKLKAWIQPLEARESFATTRPG